MAAAAPTVIAASYPAGADLRDVAATYLANLPVAPDFGPQYDETALVIFAGWAHPPAITPAQVTTMQQAVAATVADPSAPWRNRDAIAAQLASDLATLRNVIALPDATSATLAQLNGLLHVVQSLARIELRIVRELTKQYDALG